MSGVNSKKAGLEHDRAPEIMNEAEVDVTNAKAKRLRLTSEYLTDGISLLSSYSSRFLL